MKRSSNSLPVILKRDCIANIYWFSSKDYILLCIGNSMDEVASMVGFRSLVYGFNSWLIMKCFPSFILSNYHRILVGSFSLSNNTVGQSPVTLRWMQHFIYSSNQVCDPGHLRVAQKTRVCGSFAPWSRRRSTSSLAAHTHAHTCTGLLYVYEYALNHL